jgi:predicted Zn-dependent protease
MKDLLKRAAETSSRLVETLGRLEAAIGASDATEAYTAAGRVNEYANHPVSAMLCYEAASDQRMPALEAKARLAIVQLKSSLTDEALSTIRSVVFADTNFTFASLDGNPISAMTVLGDVLRAQGVPNALETYAKATEIEPDDRYAVGCYAEMLVETGHLKDALALKSRIPEGDDFASLRATLRLAENDPKLLPALVGVSRSSGRVAHHA